MDKLLRGGEGGLSASHFSRLADNPLLPSTPLSSSPHVKILEAYETHGEALFEPGVLEKTDYYRNAHLVIDTLGRYFDARSPEEIQGLVRRFVDVYLEKDLSGLARQEGQSKAGSPPVVRPIENSDCFEIVDGHHRLAIGHMRGDTVAAVRVRGKPTRTPLQILLGDVLWLEGRRELYQPIPFPEVQKNWQLVRKCSDRFEKMNVFLKERALDPSNCDGYLDVGSSYGWFVGKMSEYGFDAWGVERDPIATTVGQWVYGLHPEQITKSECTRFLQSSGRTYDIVSCFSVLHHFVLGKGGGVSAEELMRLLESVTNQVLFFDTGQGHEAWFRKSLVRGADDWSPDFIESWLRKNTSFREIHRLGTDEDAVPPFSSNYSRMLFACVR